VGGGEKGCSVEVYTGYLLNVQSYSEDALRKGLRGEQTMCAKKEFATNNSQLRTKMLEVRSAFCDVSRSHRGPPHASNTFQNKTPYSGTIHSPSEDRPLGNRSPALSYSEQTTASQEEHFPPNDNTFIQKKTPSFKSDQSSAVVLVPAPLQRLQQASLAPERPARIPGLHLLVVPAHETHVTEVQPQLMHRHSRLE
jgi:hypothetical protein